MAEIFDDLLRRRWEAGDDSASNVAIAERILGVTEKVVRKWRDPSRSHDKPLPMAVRLILPDSFNSELDDLIARERMGLPLASHAINMLRASIAKLVGKSFTEAERVQLMELHARLGALIFGGPR